MGFEIGFGELGIVGRRFSSGKVEGCGCGISDSVCSGASEGGGGIGDRVDGCIANRSGPAFEIELMSVSSLGASADNVVLALAFEPSDLAELSASEELRADTATDPIPMTALPNKLSAEAPVPSKIDEAV